MKRAAQGPAALPLAEFVPMAALMISLVALSIDAMLPALPAIARDLRVANPNDTQLVVSALVLGLTLGQLVYGPMSDSLGRRPAILAGFALFAVGCTVCVLATSFPVMLLGRVLQGIGVAGPRVVTVALVRDQYEGREMARVMSFVMAVFILVPVLAPAAGQLVLTVANWRAIFAAFLALATTASVWFALRQPETLPTTARIPFTTARITASVREILTTPAALGYTVCTGLVFAPFLGYLSSAQQVFTTTYALGDRFPLYFAALALTIGSAAAVNARMVRRLGMRRLARAAAASLSVIAAASWLLAWRAGGVPPLAQFMACMAAAFFCVGILFGNLNALAMRPLGHIAGIGAAVVGALSTALAIPLGALLGRAYDGTVLALLAGFAIFAGAALLVMLAVERSARDRNVTSA